MRKLLILSTALLLLTGCFDEATTVAKDEVLREVQSHEHDDFASEDHEHSDLARADEVVPLAAYEALLARVERLEAEVGDAENDFQNSRIDANETSVGGELDNRISALEVEVGGAEDADGGLVGSRIDEVYEDGPLTSRFDTLEGDVDSLQATLADPATPGTNLGDALVALQSEVDLIDGVVGGGYSLPAGAASMAEVVAANTAAAATAQSTADQAVTDAATAQGTADQAVTAAATAQGTADGAYDEVSGDADTIALSRIDLLEGGLGVVEGALDDGTGSPYDVGALEAAISANTASISDNTSDIADLTAELDGSADTISGSRLDALDDALDDGQGGLVDVLLQGTVTYTVGSDPMDDFVDLHEALASLDGVAIAQDALVTLEIQPGTHTYSAPIEVNHPDGARIQIIGTGGASATILEFNDTDGLRVRWGSQLGLLDGLTLVDNGPVLGDGVRGLRVMEVSYAELGPSVSIEGFSLGVEVSGSSWLYAPMLALEGNYQALAVYNASAAYLEGVVVGADGSQPNSLDGLACTGNSYINAINSQVEGFYRYGMFAARGGVIEAWGSDFGTAANGGTGQANGTDRKLAAEPGDIRWIAW